MAMRAQSIDPDKAGVEWREDMMNNNWVSIKVATENLQKKQQIVKVAA